MKKQPKQKRSQVMVEAILEAATRILSQDQLDHVSTNKLADVAGVSIGSLYDYFPNKNSIVVTLMDQHMQSQLDRFYKTLENETSLEKLVEVIIQMIEQDYMNRKIFLRQVFLLAPESGRMQTLFLNRLKAQTELKKFMIEKAGKTEAWAERKSFIATNAILGAVESYIIVDEIHFTKDEFKTEIRQIMLSILELS